MLVTWKCHNITTIKIGLKFFILQDHNNNTESLPRWEILLSFEKRSLLLDSRRLESVLLMSLLRFTSSLTVVESGNCWCDVALDFWEWSDGLLTGLDPASKTYINVNLEHSFADRLKARLQPFTVLFSFSAILVCFIDAQIHSFFHEKLTLKSTQFFMKKWVDLSVNKTNQDRAERKKYCKRP